MITPIALMLIALAGSGWQCEQDEKGLWQCAGAAAVVEPTAPVEPVAASSRPVVAGSAAGPTESSPSRPVTPSAAAPVNASATVESYVLQVGAFRDQAIAKAGARKIDSDTLTIVPTWRGDETWYILILGAYTRRDHAEAAGKAYQEAFDGADYWVRRASELTEVLPPSEVAFPIKRGRLPE